MKRPWANLRRAVLSTRRNQTPPALALSLIVLAIGRHASSTRPDDFQDDRGYDSADCGQESRERLEMGRVHVVVLRKGVALKDRLREPSDSDDAVPGRRTSGRMHSAHSS